MNQKYKPIDVSNLSSRKLWQLLNLETDQLPSTQQQYVEQELRLRRHYLNELKDRQCRIVH